MTSIENSINLRDMQKADLRWMLHHFLNVKIYNTNCERGIAVERDFPFDPSAIACLLETVFMCPEPSTIE